MSGLLTWQLALRYLRGKKSANAVPILSRISMVAIAVGTGAMIVLFSVFNGFEALVKDTYKAFYPDIKISPARGKFFKLDSSQLLHIIQVEGVNSVTNVIEDNVLAKEDNMGGGANKGNDNQLVLTLKGIDKQYFKVNNIHQYLLGTVDSVSEGQPNTAIAGEQVIKELGVDFNNLFSYIMLYYLDPTVTNPEADPASAFQSLRLHPAGAFSVLEEFDSRYILAPLHLAQNLFHAEGMYSSIEINAQPNDIPVIKDKLQKLLGNGYVIASRYEQNKTMYLVMNTEKWAVYLILLLVLLIASFNMVGALSMLVLEKQKDIAILKAMGMTPAGIQQVVLLEGVLWSLTGGLAGLFLGCGICLLQMKFGLVKINGSFLVDAYPVKIEFTDILVVVATIIVVGVLASLYPSLKATKTIDPSLKGA